MIKKKWEITLKKIILNMSENFSFIKERQHLEADNEPKKVFQKENEEESENALSHRVNHMENLTDKTSC